MSEDEERKTREGETGYPEEPLQEEAIADREKEREADVSVVGEDIESRKERGAPQPDPTEPDPSTSPPGDDA
jgi:hypothetical protein